MRTKFWKRQARPGTSIQAVGLINSKSGLPMMSKEIRFKKSLINGMRDPATGIHQPSARFNMTKMVM